MFCSILLPCWVLSVCYHRNWCFTETHSPEQAALTGRKRTHTSHMRIHYFHVSSFIPKMPIYGIKSFKKLSPHYSSSVIYALKCSILVINVLPPKMVILGCKSVKAHVQNPALIKAINFTLYLCSEALLCRRVQRNALAGDGMNGNVYQWKYLDLYPQTGLLSCGRFNLKRHKHLWPRGFSLSCFGLIQTAFSVTSLHLLWTEMFGSRNRNESKCSSF